MNLNLFDSFPIAGGYVGVSILMLVFSEVGYQFGAHARTSQDKEAPSSLGPMVGGVNLARFCSRLHIFYRFSSARS
jgi:hypothetical protein